MAIDGRPAADVRSAPLASADFVRLLVRADGDAVAAAGLLTRALTGREIPFQVTVTETVAERTSRVGDVADDEVTVVVGSIDETAPSTESAGDDASHRTIRIGDRGRPSALDAFDLVSDQGWTTDPVLALAGALAAGVEPGVGPTESVLEAARAGDRIRSRSGVGVPTSDPIDGLAHSTRVLGPWSGDAAAVRETIESVAPSAVGDSGSVTGDERRAIASAVALDVVGHDGVPERAAHAVSTVLGPFETPGAPTETLEGYAELLSTAARTEPGTAIALAMGHSVRERAISIWRSHGEGVHGAIESAQTGRYDGLYVVEVDETTRSSAALSRSVGSLVADYRSPEPVVLTVADDAAAVVRRDDGAGANDSSDRSADWQSTVRSIAVALDVPYDVDRRGAIVRLEDSDHDRRDVITAVRDEL